MRSFALVLFVLTSLIAHGLAARWAMNAFPSLAARRGLVIKLTIALGVLPGVARVMARSGESPAATAIFAAFMVEVVAVMTAAVPLTIASGLVRGLGALFFARRTEAAAYAEVETKAEADAEAEAEPNADARKRDATAAPPPAFARSANAPPARSAREGGRLTRGAREGGPRPPQEGRRQALERVAGVGVFGASGLALGWGALRGRHEFALEEVVVRVAGWPKALEGYTIAQVSDVHLGAFVGERELDAGLELVRRARPDLVVATGDLVDFRAELVPVLASRLADMPARDGAVAILGNHDHYAGAADVAEALRTSRVRVLHNESVRVRRGDGGGFALVGVDDLAARRRPSSGGFTGPDLSRALEGVPPDVPRILLAHQPRFFLESAGRVALQLSGHTHGGQINPGFRPADLFMTFVAGRYERGGSTMWVNRGFGVVGPPSRVGAPPEVTKIVIVAA